MRFNNFLQYIPLPIDVRVPMHTAIRDEKVFFPNGLVNSDCLR